MGVGGDRSAPPSVAPLRLGVALGRGRLRAHLDLVEQGLPAAAVIRRRGPRQVDPRRPVRRRRQPRRRAGRRYRRHGGGARDRRRIAGADRVDRRDPVVARGPEGEAGMGVGGVGRDGGRVQLAPLRIGVARGRGRLRAYLDLVVGDGRAAVIRRRGPRQVDFRRPTRRRQPRRRAGRGGRGGDAQADRDNVPDVVGVPEKAGVLPFDGVRVGGDTIRVGEGIATVADPQHPVVRRIAERAGERERQLRAGRDKGVNRVVGSVPPEPGVGQRTHRPAVPPIPTWCAPHREAGRPERARGRRIAGHGRRGGGARDRRRIAGAGRVDRRDPVVARGPEGEAGMGIGGGGRDGGRVQLAPLRIGVARGRGRLRAYLDLVVGDGRAAVLRRRGPRQVDFRRPTRRRRQPRRRAGRGGGGALNDLEGNAVTVHPLRVELDIRPVKLDAIECCVGESERPGVVDNEIPVAVGGRGRVENNIDGAT